MMSFKLAIVLVVVAFVAAVPPHIPEDIRQEMVANANACKDEHKVEVPLKTIFTSDADQPENIKCFMECIYNKNGLFKDGHINREKFVRATAYHSNEEIAHQIADACVTDAELKGCDAFANLHKCLVKKMKEIAPEKLSDNDH